MECSVCNGAVFMRGTTKENETPILFAFSTCSRECARVAYQENYQREMNRELIRTLEWMKGVSF